MISKDQLSRIMPGAKGVNLEKFCLPLNDSMVKHGIDNPKRIAAFLAQLAHESNSFSATVENLNYSAQGLLKIFGKYFNPTTANLFAHKPEQIANKVYANRLGNGPELSGDGYRFRGRGLIQITGKTNYQAASKGLGLPAGNDFVAHPELLEGPVYACESAAWFWNSRGLSLLADADNFRQITIKINGGLNGWDDRLAFWNAAKLVLG